MKGKILTIVTRIGYQHDNGSQESWNVDPRATITLNGNPATLGDLMPGDHVEFSGRPATSVVVTRERNEAGQDVMHDALGREFVRELTPQEKAVEQHTTAEAQKAADAADSHQAHGPLGGRQFTEHPHPTTQPHPQQQPKKHK